MSGLFAASRLLEREGTKVVLLEVRICDTINNSNGTWFSLQASGRLGGRVEAAIVGEARVELGAQWIHGRGECPLWRCSSPSSHPRFALDNGLEVAADSGGDGDGVFYLPGGERVEEGLLRETLDYLEQVPSTYSPSSTVFQIHEELDMIGQQVEASCCTLGLSKPRGNYTFMQDIPRGRAPVRWPLLQPAV